MIRALALAAVLLATPASAALFEHSSGAIDFTGAYPSGETNVPADLFPLMPYGRDVTFAWQAHPTLYVPFFHAGKKYEDRVWCLPFYAADAWSVRLSVDDCLGRTPPPPVIPPVIPPDPTPAAVPLPATLGLLLAALGGLGMLGRARG